jgi:hypothetical protein
MFLNFRIKAHHTKAYNKNVDVIKSYIFYLKILVSAYVNFLEEKLSYTPTRKVV